MLESGPLVMALETISKTVSIMRSMRLQKKQGFRAELSSSSASLLESPSLHVSFVASVVAYSNFFCNLSFLKEKEDNWKRNDYLELITGISLHGTIPMCRAISSYSN